MNRPPQAVMMNQPAPVNMMNQPGPVNMMNPMGMLNLGQQVNPLANNRGNPHQMQGMIPRSGNKYHNQHRKR